MRYFYRLQQVIDSRLQPSYIALASGGIVAMGIVLVLASFITSKQGQTVFGIPLGADFAGFYVASQILNQGQSDRLYDRALHDTLYHELLPNEDVKVSIPYVHPPFVAGLLRAISWLPYPMAVGVWTVISASLYIAGLLLVLKSVPWPNPHERWLIILLSLSFEPFLFECWIGGQLSAMAFFSYSLFFAFHRNKKPFSAGMALGLCFYKPTLLLLTLPLLVIGRRWSMLCGMLLTGLTLVAISVALVGWDVNVGYLKVLLEFRKSATGGDLAIRTWKYVDLNNCLRLALGDGSAMIAPLFLAIGIVPGLALARVWWFNNRLRDDENILLWATTITWIPVLNFYFGIYDSILMVQSLIISASSISIRSQSPEPLLRSGFAYLVFVIATVPWFSQNLAAQTGIPVYTLLMIAFGCYQLLYLFRIHPEFYRIR